MLGVLVAESNSLPGRHDVAGDGRAARPARLRRELMGVGWAMKAL